MISFMFSTASLNSQDMVRILQHLGHDFLSKRLCDGYYVDIIWCLCVEVNIQQWIHNTKWTPLPLAPKWRGGMRFFKNGCNEAVVVSWWEIFTRNGGKPGMEWVRGGGVIIGGWEIFRVSLHSWQRGANPQFYKDLPILPTPHLQPPPPLFSVVLFLWLPGWSRHIWCAILLNGNMDLLMSSLGTLVPEKTLMCVLCNKA